MCDEFTAFIVGILWGMLILYLIFFSIAKSNIEKLIRIRKNKK